MGDLGDVPVAEQGRSGPRDVSECADAFRRIVVRSRTVELGRPRPASVSREYGRLVAGGRGGAVASRWSNSCSACLVTKEGLAKNRSNEKLLGVPSPDYADAGRGRSGSSLKALADLPRAGRLCAAGGAGPVRRPCLCPRLCRRQARWPGLVDFDDLIGRASELLKHRRHGRLDPLQARSAYRSYAGR